MAYDKLPSWIQEKIKKAINLEETGLADYISEYEKAKKESNDNAEVIQAEDDELPF